MSTGTISLYTRREMLDVLRQVHIPGSFLLTTFVNSKKTHTTDNVDIDIIKKGKKMAPFVSPVREGVVFDREGYTTRNVKIPYTKIKSPCTSQEFLERQPGNTVYSSGSAASYASGLLGEDLVEIDQMMFRREEWMAAQCIQFGSVIAQGEGDSINVDFGMRADHQVVLTGTDAWDQTTADIQKDLVTWRRKIFQSSGISPTDAILGVDASAAMLRNTSFIGALDRRRIDRGEIDVERMADNVVYYGRDSESGLDLWGYEETYIDDWTDPQNPVENYLIEPKRVVVGSRRSRFTKHYGAIQNVKTNFVGERYPSNWITDDPAVAWVMLESSPLVALHQPDAWLSALVLE